MLRCFFNITLGSIELLAKGRFLLHGLHSGSYRIRDYGLLPMELAITNSHGRACCGIPYLTTLNNLSQSKEPRRSKLPRTHFDQSIGDFNKKPPVVQ